MAEYEVVREVQNLCGNNQMRDVAAKMNDREIKAVSDYIAGLR